jgi:hypothetical protein
VAAVIAMLSLSMISAGVFLGAPTPYQALAFVAWHEITDGRDGSAAPDVTLRRIL